jgi:hypothetical protein
MPLARIITRALQESQELAAELRGRGYEVEIVSPSEICTSPADLELQVEDCTPEEALIRAGVLPDRDDLSVFIAPGAISSRQVYLNTKLVEASVHRAESPAPRKWYEPSSSASIASEEPLDTAMEPMRVEAVKAVDPTMESSVERAEVRSQPIPQDLISTFSDALNSIPSTPFATKPSSRTIPRPKSTPVGTPRMQSKYGMQVISEIDEVLGHPVALIRRQSSRLRIRIPSSWAFSMHAWKSRAALIALAAIVLTMTVWVVRRAPAPAQLGVTPAAAATPVSVPAGQQIASPNIKTKSKLTHPKAKVSAATSPTPNPEPSPKAPRRSVNDGIKRYSDLD